MIRYLNCEETGFYEGVCAQQQSFTGNSQCGMCICLAIFAARFLDWLYVLPNGKFCYMCMFSPASVTKVNKYFETAFQSKR